MMARFGVRRARSRKLKRHCLGDPTLSSESGVHPSSAGLSISAPRASSRRMQASSPFRQVECSAVKPPCWVASTGTPAASKRSRIGARASGTRPPAVAWVARFCLSFAERRSMFAPRARSNSTLLRWPKCPARWRAGQPPGPGVLSVVGSASRAAVSAATSPDRAASRTVIIGF